MGDIRKRIAGFFGKGNKGVAAQPAPESKSTAAQPAPESKSTAAQPASKSETLPKDFDLQFQTLKSVLEKIQTNQTIKHKNEELRSLLDFITKNYQISEFKNKITELEITQESLNDFFEFLMHRLIEVNADMEYKILTEIFGEQSVEKSLFRASDMTSESDEEDPALELDEESQEESDESKSDEEDPADSSKLDEESQEESDELESDEEDPLDLSELDEKSQEELDKSKSAEEQLYYKFECSDVLFPIEGEKIKITDDAIKAFLKQAQQEKKLKQTYFEQFKNEFKQKANKKKGKFEFQIINWNPFLFKLALNSIDDVTFSKDSFNNKLLEFLKTARGAFLTSIENAIKEVAEEKRNKFLKLVPTNSKKEIGQLFNQALQPDRTSAKDLVISTASRKTSKPITSTLQKRERFSFRRDKTNQIRLYWCYNNQLFVSFLPTLKETKTTGEEVIEKIQITDQDIENFVNNIKKINPETTKQNCVTNFLNDFCEKTKKIKFEFQIKKWSAFKLKLALKSIKNVTFSKDSLSTLQTFILNNYKENKCPEVIKECGLDNLREFFLKTKILEATQQNTIGRSVFNADWTKAEAARKAAEEARKAEKEAEARRKAEEEEAAKKAAEEEAARKAAEEEAKRKAKEEARKKKEKEEARKREEAKRKAKEEARKAEEEAAREAQKTYDLIDSRGNKITFSLKEGEDVKDWEQYVYFKSTNYEIIQCSKNRETKFVIKFTEGENIFKLNVAKQTVGEETIYVPCLKQIATPKNPFDQLFYLQNFNGQLIFRQADLRLDTKEQNKASPTIASELQRMSNIGPVNVSTSEENLVTKFEEKNQSDSLVVLSKITQYDYTSLKEGEYRRKLLVDLKIPSSAAIFDQRILGYKDTTKYMPSSSGFKITEYKNNGNSYFILEKDEQKYLLETFILTRKNGENKEETRVPGFRIVEKNGLHINVIIRKDSKGELYLQKVKDGDFSTQVEVNPKQPVEEGNLEWQSQFYTLKRQRVIPKLKEQNAFSKVVDFFSQLSVKRQVNKIIEQAKTELPKDLQEYFEQRLNPPAQKSSKYSEGDEIPPLKSLTEMQDKIYTFVLKLKKTKTSDDLEQVKIAYGKYLNKLGFMYKRGTTDVKKDLAHAVELYQRAADLGNAYAMFNLGCCYQYGEGVKQDYKKSAEFYQRAADKGNASAMNNLGLCCQHGIGVKKDEEKAVELFQQAANKGNANAMFNLGVCYENGIIVKKDEKRAVELYWGAVCKDNADAMVNFGRCYENGIGVRQDKNKAFEFFQRAAGLGNTRAIFDLGRCYENGIGVRQDKNKAFEFFQRAADLGNADAMVNLGRCYENGIGVRQDKNKAFELFQRAADLDNTRAIFNLGVCYENGISVKKDEKKAIELFQRAADLGNAYAMNNLGNRYFNGNGVKQNEQRAIEYFKRAADKGILDAKLRLEEIERKTEAEKEKKEEEEAKRKAEEEEEARRKAEEEARRKAEEEEEARRKAEEEEAKRKAEEEEAKRKAEEEEARRKAEEEEAARKAAEEEARRKAEEEEEARRKAEEEEAKRKAEEEEEARRKAEEEEAARKAAEEEARRKAEEEEAARKAAEEEAARKAAEEEAARKAAEEEAARKAAEEEAAKKRREEEEALNPVLTNGVNNIRAKMRFNQGDVYLGLKDSNSSAKSEGYVSIIPIGENQYVRATFDELHNAVVALLKNKDAEITIGGKKLSKRENPDTICQIVAQYFYTCSRMESDLDLIKMEEFWNKKCAIDTQGRITYQTAKISELQEKLNEKLHVKLDLTKLGAGPVNRGQFYGQLYVSTPGYSVAYEKSTRDAAQFNSVIKKIGAVYDQLGITPDTETTGASDDSAIKYEYIKAASSVMSYSQAQVYGKKYPVGITCNIPFCQQTYAFGAVKDLCEEVKVYTNNYREYIYAPLPGYTPCTRFELLGNPKSVKNNFITDYELKQWQHSQLTELLKTLYLNRILSSKGKVITIGMPLNFIDALAPDSKRLYKKIAREVLTKLVSNAETYGIENKLIVADGFDIIDKKTRQVKTSPTLRDNEKQKVKLVFAGNRQYPITALAGLHETYGSTRLSNIFNYDEIYVDEDGNIILVKNDLLGKFQDQSGKEYSMPKYCINGIPYVQQDEQWYCCHSGMSLAKAYHGLQDYLNKLDLSTAQYIGSVNEVSLDALGDHLGAVGRYCSNTGGDRSADGVITGLPGVVEGLYGLGNPQAIEDYKAKKVKIQEISTPQHQPQPAPQPAPQPVPQPASQPVPQYKPQPESQSVSRDESLESIPFPNKPIKLHNSRNDCYINSVLQIILNMPAFAEFIMQIDTTGVDKEWEEITGLIQEIQNSEGDKETKDDLIKDIKKQNASLLKQKKIVRELQRLVVKKLSQQGENITLNTHILATLVFGSNEQQDAQEFYAQILNFIESCLSKQAQEQVLEQFRDLFINSTHQKEYKANSKENTSDPLKNSFPALDLIESPLKLEDLVKNQLTTDEKGVEYTFPNDKASTKDTKVTTTYTELPPVLFLQLQAFKFNPETQESQKKQFQVDIPEELNLSVNGTQKTYKLYGVVNHVGPTANSGHYTTWLNAGMAHIGSYGTFLHANDEELGQILLPTNSSDPYLYFYVDEGKEDEIFKTEIRVNRKVFKKLRRELSQQTQSIDVEVDTPKTSDDLDLEYRQALKLEKKQNMDGAIKIYEKLAGQNHLDAILRLADIYEKGTDVKQDMNKSIELYQKAANELSLDAMLRLANIYENGKGNIPEDRNKAFVYYELAAAFFEYSNVAIYNLARCYKNGIGVEIDKNKAIELYRQAAKLGNSFAKQHLAEPNKQDSKHFSPIGYAEETKNKPKQLEEFEFLHLLDGKKEFYDITEKEGDKSNKNPDFVIVNAGNSSLEIVGGGLNGACQRLYSDEQVSINNKIKIVFGEQINKESFKISKYAKGEYGTDRYVGCIFVQLEEQKITHLYAIGPRYKDFRDMDEKVNKKHFFEDLKFANDAIFNTIKLHYTELAGKTIFFSGVSNEIFADGLVSPDINGRIPHPNIVDYFDAFCFMDFIQRNKAKLREHSIHIYLNKSISVAVQALCNEKTRIDALALLNQNVKFEKEQKFAYTPGKGFELVEKKDEGDGDGGYYSSDSEGDPEFTDDEEIDTTPKQPQFQSQTLKPQPQSKPQPLKFETPKKDLPIKQLEKGNVDKLLSKIIQDKIDEIKKETTKIPQSETRTTPQEKQMEESPQIRTLKALKLMALIYEQGKIIDINIEFKNGEISPLKNSPEEAKQRLEVLQKIYDQSENGNKPITIDAKIEGASETYSKKVLSELFANEFLEAAKETSKNPNNTIHNFEITRNINTGVLTIKVEGIGEYVLPISIELGQVNEVVEAISNQDQTKLEALRIDIQSLTPQNGEKMDDNRFQAMLNDQKRKSSLVNESDSRTRILG